MNLKIGTSKTTFFSVNAHVQKINARKPIAFVLHMAEAVIQNNVHAKIVKITINIKML